MVLLAGLATRIHYTMLTFTSSFLFFYVMISCVSTASSRSANVRLPRLQAENLWQLFVDRNAAIQFDFKQKDHTEAVLMAAYRQLPFQKLLEIKVSTVENKITFTHLTVSGAPKTFKMNAPINDGDWHKLVFVINGDEVQIIDNCRQLLKKAVYDMDYPNVLNVRVHIGEDIRQKYVFQGKLREFSADSGNPIQLRCPNLEIMMDSPVETIYDEDAPAEKEIEVDIAEFEKKFSTFPDDSGKDVTVDDNTLTMTRYDERLQYLEDQFKHWKSLVQGLDIRLKTVEIHQRGCQLGGRIISFGEKQQNAINCTECQCSTTGELHCGPIGCPYLTCAHPIQTFGECCPKCGAQCFYNGQAYDHGEEVWPKPCVRCSCVNGKVSCQFKKNNNCPALSCPQQQTPENQCCPVCVNIDYCLASENSPCDPNAECSNGEYGPHCKCKQGFFGNGTTCYDIDECLWDDNARQQLGGCQMGTLCINLPGSFKCDCLPGFQRLDERNCLDVIRV